MRKFILLIGCMLLGLSFSQIALAEEGILLFGPETFTRGKGKPITEIKTFSVLEPSIETTLNIVNGDSEGNFRVSSAEIYLNNELVVGPNRFNQMVGSISVPVVLANGENKITVEVRSKPESFINIDITAPNITIGPEGGTVLTTAGTKVEIPPGALTENTIITIDTLTEETLPAPVPEKFEFLGAANFQPDGLTFNIPVTITIPLNIILPPGTYLALSVFDPETGEFVYAEKYGIVDESWSFVSVEVDHFSAFAFLRGLFRVAIMGRVVTKDGEPVAGAKVTIKSVTDEVDNVFCPGAPTVTTGQDGFFAVSFDINGYLLKFFEAEAVAPWGATGEAGGDIIELFNFKSFVATLLGVPTDWPGLAAFVLKLLRRAGPPPRALTTDLIGYGGGVKIEVERKTILFYVPPDWGTDYWGITWTNPHDHQISVKVQPWDGAMRDVRGASWHRWKVNILIYINRQSEWDNRTIHGNPINWDAQFEGGVYDTYEEAAPHTIEIAPQTFEVPANGYLRFVVYNNLGNDLDKQGITFKLTYSNTDDVGSTSFPIEPPSTEEYNIELEEGTEEDTGIAY